MLFIWAMNRDAEVTKRAVPSIFTVAPIGRTNLLGERTLTYNADGLTWKLLGPRGCLSCTSRIQEGQQLWEIYLTEYIKESSRGSCGKCSHPGLKKAAVEGKRIPPDDGQVDERISQQLVGEDCRADGDDEEPKLGHHPAVEHSPPQPTVLYRRLQGSLLQSH